jgi:hypothetical protein
MRGKLAVYTLVLGSVGGFLFGASQGSMVIMAAAPAGVVVIVLGVAAYLADNRAAKNFYLSFAATAGLEYVGQSEVLPYTPLLGAGDRQHCEHWMTGDVVKEPRRSGALGHFIYEVVRESTTSDVGRRERTEERNLMTVCMVDMEESILLYKGVFLRQHRGLLDLHHDWLAATPSRRLEVESSAFTHKYELRMSTDQDEILLRRLFSPTLVDWLAEHPLSQGFELRGGTLVVFVPRPLGDGGNLTFLLDTTREIAGRVLHEVREAVDRVAPNAKIAGL